MSFSLERKLEIINGKSNDIEVRKHCFDVVISYTTYYKWYKEIHISKKNVEFIDVTALYTTGDNNSIIDLELSSITIHVNNDYDEKHLLNVLNSLKKL